MGQHMNARRNSRLWAWLIPLSIAMWFLCGMTLAYFGTQWKWGTGEFVLASVGWLMLLAVVAREPVRNMFGPVFWYETLRLGRKRSTFICRLLYILGIVGLFTMIYLDWLRESRYEYGGGRGTVPPSYMARFAEEFFLTFAVVQLAVASLITPAFVAGSIADEKERKTLKFLLATDLQNREIIFGKLAARLLNLLMYLLAGLPIIAFLQLFGGIDPDVALATFAGTGITICGLASLGILMSVLCQKPRNAILLTYVVAIAYLFFGGILAIIIREWGRPETLFTIAGYDVAEVDFADVVGAGNIFYSLSHAMRGSGGVLNSDVMTPWLAKYAIFWSVAICGMVMVAVARLRRIALRQGKDRTQKITKRSEARNRPAPADDPMIWRECFVGSTKRTGIFGWFFRAGIVVMIAFIPISEFWSCFVIDHSSAYYYAHETLGESARRYTEHMNTWLRFTTGMICLVIYFIIAQHGAASIASERDRDTWLTLISTPLSDWEIVRGKWLGCLLAPFNGYIVLIGVWAFGLAIGATNLVMILLTILHIAIFAAAVAWAGLICSLTTKTSLGASIRAFFVTCFMCGGYFLIPFCCCVMPFQGIGSSYIIERYGTPFFMAFSPPFISGFMPLNHFNEDELGPYGFSSSREIGPMVLFVQFFVWIAICFVLGRFTLNLFRKRSGRAFGERGS